MTSESTTDNLPSRYWFVHNWESESFFPTQAEAIAEANSDLTYCRAPEDGSWADFVEDIYVGYVTHRVKRSSDGYSLERNPHNDFPEKRLCQRKIATILAALRLLQSVPSESISRAFPSYFVDCYPLSKQEIDEICELIN